MTDIHISGLVSGVDYGSMIDQLVEARAESITTVQEKKVEIEADVSAWADVSGSMSTLTECLDALRNYDTWNQVTATSSDASILTATASNSAVDACYAIGITQLAQAHSVASDRAATLGLDGATSTLVGTVSGLNEGDRFTVGGVEITIEAEDTLTTLAGKINTAAESMDEGAGVAASILDNRLVLTREDTGDTEIDVGESTGTPLQCLGILVGSAEFKNELVAAQDAVFTVNGAEVTRSDNRDLTDVITGVSLSLLDDTQESGSMTLTVGRDTETPRQAIEWFVEAYNAVVEKLVDYTSVDLTDPKNPVTGVLQDDALARELLVSIRRLATASKQPYLNAYNAGYTYGGATGVCDSLATIGVWTSGTDNSLDIVDEDRLDYMLENNFSAVESMFRGVSGDDWEGLAHGVALDFYEYSEAASTSLTGRIAQRTTNLEEKITEKDEQIDKMYDDLDAYEQSLWDQFTAMEEAIASLQSDLDYLLESI